MPSAIANEIELHEEWREYDIPSNTPVPISVLSAILREALPSISEAEILKTIETIDRRWLNDKNQKLTKRIGKAVKRNHKISLASGFYGALHHLQEQFGAKAMKLRYKDVAREGFWPVGKYGDSGSCYWGCHSAAKDILQNNNCYAIQYDINGELGRTWAYQSECGLIIFNHYGPSTLLSLAAIISGKSEGFEHRKIDLCNNGEASGTFWINHGSGYLISQAPQIHEYDFEFEDNSYRCEHCECSIHEEDTFYVEGLDFLPVCEGCYCQLTSVCESCHETYPTEEITEVDGTRLCGGCLLDEAIECSCCNELTLNDNINLIIGGECACESCLPREYEHCEDCGCVCVNTNVEQQYSTFDGDYYCPECKEVEIVDETISLPNYSFDLSKISNPITPELFQSRWDKIKTMNPPENWTIGNCIVVAFNLTDRSIDERLTATSWNSDNGLWSITIDQNSSRTGFKVLHHNSECMVGSVDTISQALSIVAIAEYYCSVSDWAVVKSSSDLTGNAHVAGRAILAFTRSI